MGDASVSIGPVSDERLRAASAALRKGRLVILPTETLYGVAANAQDPQAIALLRDLVTTSIGTPQVYPPLTWHCDDVSRVCKTLSITHPRHLRVCNRVLPGPIRIVVKPSDANADEARRLLRVLPGTIDASGEFSFRVPDDSTVRAVLAAAGGAIVMDRIGVLGLGDGRELPADIRERASTMGIAHILDSGPTRFGKPSSSIRLAPDGGFRILSEGAWEARYIHKKMASTILFVCTGNTCRSAMAEAIARDLLLTEGDRDSKVLSAGIAANDGTPMTPEAQEALGELGIKAGRHFSRSIDADLLADANHIFTMTRSHLAALRATASREDFAKAKVLDPGNGDIEDPIGGPIEEYRQTAHRLRDLIRARFQELGLIRSS